MSWYIHQMYIGYFKGSNRILVNFVGMYVFDIDGSEGYNIPYIFKRYIIWVMKLRFFILFVLEDVF